MLNYHFSRGMASYDWMRINGKLRPGIGRDQAPPSTVARSAWARAPQFCGLEFRARTKPLQL